MRTSMKCPVCEYDMSKKASRSTRSSIGKAYDWTQYHCQRDDVWMEVEIPPEDDKK